MRPVFAIFTLDNVIHHRRLLLRLGRLTMLVWLQTNYCNSTNYIDEPSLTFQPMSQSNTQFLTAN